MLETELEAITIEFSILIEKKDNAIKELEDTTIMNRQCMQSL